MWGNCAKSFSILGECTFYSCRQQRHLALNLATRGLFLLAYSRPHLSPAKLCKQRAGVSTSSNLYGRHPHPQQHHRLIPADCKIRQYSKFLVFTLPHFRVKLMFYPCSHYPYNNFTWEQRNNVGVTTNLDLTFP